jgi:hypothetical protein
MLSDDPPVLVVALNQPLDLVRAHAEGWYRIPLARAPRRIAADYLAFYQTGAFPPEERWAVRWLAPVQAYHVVTRSVLIPDEHDHPRAGDLYYKVSLGPLEALPRPIPSRRLRRITFISTTLGRLRAAQEINDLWIKSSAQERLWAALKALEVAAERQYPIDDDLPDCVVDFAVPGASPAALIVTDEPPEENAGHELAESVRPDYLLARHHWQTLYATCRDLTRDPLAWAQRLLSAAQG